MGIDPEILAIGTEMAAYHIEAGARKFADYARNMIADLGEAIRPYLKAFYNDARYMPEVQKAGLADEMTPYDEVQSFDIINFDKKEPFYLQGHDIIKIHNITTMEENIIEKPQVTMEDILSVFKNYSDVKRMAEIKNAVVAKFTPTDQLICPDEDFIVLEVERLIKEDRKRNNESWLTYSNGKYRKRKNKPGPDPVANQNSTYIGTAGECAVMSELMFNGYNANRMMIDEGADIIAVKDNMYYYIQVKTSFVKDNSTVHWQISKDRFEQFSNAQMRYIFVARYKDHDTNKNMFFTFPTAILNDAIYNRCVKRGDAYITIKIKFNQKTGEPVLYDEKEKPVGNYMNNFDL